MQSEVYSAVCDIMFREYSLLFCKHINETAARATVSRYVFTIETLWHRNKFIFYISGKVRISKWYGYIVLGQKFNKSRKTFVFKSVLSTNKDFSWPKSSSYFGHGIFILWGNWRGTFVLITHEILQKLRWDSGRYCQGSQCTILPHVTENTRSRLVECFGTVEGDTEDVVSKNLMSYALL